MRQELGRGRGGVFFDDLGDGRGELSAHAAPVADAFVLELDRSRAGAGVIGSHHLDGATIAGAVLLDDDYAVIGLLAGANARQTNHDHGDTVPFKIRCCLRLWAGRPLREPGRAKRKARLSSPASARLNI